MKKLAIAFAGLAALGFAGAAFAEDGTTSTAPATMTDSQMDAVTAGAPGGNCTAANGACEFGAARAGVVDAGRNAPSGGNCQASAQGQTCH
jgi:hypothetical protein